jgi:hypothetical protein
MKSIITTISLILSIFFGIGYFISTGVGGKYPQSNMWGFGLLSLFFGVIFWISFKWKRR